MDRSISFSMDIIYRGRQETNMHWQTGSTGNSGKGLAICDGPIAIAEVIGTGYPLGKGVGTNDLANARLIASAPDMLAALEAIVREPQGKTVADNAKVLSAVIRIARKAIDKARI